LRFLVGLGMESSSIFGLASSNFIAYFHWLCSWSFVSAFAAFCPSIIDSMTERGLISRAFRSFPVLNRF
jgi:hypothetical protein